MEVNQYGYTSALRFTVRSLVNCFCKVNLDLISVGMTCDLASNVAFDS